VLRALNKIDPKIKFKEDELFSLSCVFVQILKPRRIFSEMTPMNEQFSEDHYVVAAQIEALGYDVTVTERLPSHLCKEIMLVCGEGKQYIPTQRRKGKVIKVYKLSGQSSMFQVKFTHGKIAWDEEVPLKRIFDNSSSGE